MSINTLSNGGVINPNNESVTWSSETLKDKLAYLTFNYNAVTKEKMVKNFVAYQYGGTYTVPIIYFY